MQLSSSSLAAALSEPVKSNVTSCTKDDLESKGRNSTSDQQLKKETDSPDSTVDQVSQVQSCDGVTRVSVHNEDMYEFSSDVEVIDVTMEEVEDMMEDDDDVDSMNSDCDDSDHDDDDELKCHEV